MTESLTYKLKSGLKKYFKTKMSRNGRKGKI